MEVIEKLPIKKAPENVEGASDVGGSVTVSWTRAFSLCLLQTEGHRIQMNDVQVFKQTFLVVAPEQKDLPSDLRRGVQLSLEAH